MKNVWITGSTRGIGKKIADELENLDCNVIRHGTKDGDLTNQQKVIDIVTFLPNKIDTLICCIGFKNPGDCFSDISILDQMIRINLYSAVLCCQETAKKMIKYQEGNIITIGSVDGCFGKEEGVFYATAKAALHIFTRCFAKQLQKYNIKVNCIAPGTINSDDDRLKIVSFVKYLVTNNHGFSGQVIRIDKGHHTFPC